jgi:hypothetical protein
LLSIDTSNKVLLDLNYPAFQAELFDLDAAEAGKIFKTLKKLRAMTWNEVFRDHGLKWEEPKSVPGRYTIRLSQSYRQSSRGGVRNFV